MNPFRKTLLSAALSLAGLTSAAQAAIWPNVVVQLHGAGKAYVVDTRTDQVVAAVDTVKGGTLGSTTPNARKLYIGGAAEGQREVVVLDLQTHRVSKRLDTGNRPKHPLVSPNGRWVGVNHWGLDDGKLRVSFIDTRDDHIAKVIELEVKNPNAKGVASMHNAWSPDSRWFYTVNRLDNELVVIDTRHWTHRTYPVPSAPHYPVPSHDGRELWLVHEGSASTPPGIVVYDTHHMQVVAYPQIPVKGEAVEAHHGNFTRDGRYFMALNRGPGKNLKGNELAVFDARSKVLVHELQTGSSGIGHAYNTPSGRHAVITNYGNNVISVVDTRTWRLVQDITLGNGRMGHIAFTRDGRFGYVSNDQDGALYKLDMNTLQPAGKIETAGKPGGGQVLNVWTNVFEELPR